MRDYSGYDDYWQKRGTLNAIFRRWEIAAAIVPRDATLLDTGCGTGEFLQYLKSVRPDVKAEGADDSHEAIAMTQSLGFSVRQLDLVRDSVESAFDIVTCFEVIEHISEAEHALRTLKSAFRKQLIVSIPNIGYIGSRIRLALFGRFPITNCQLHIKEHLRHWTVLDFKEWIALEDLRVVRIEGQYGPRWLPWRRFPSLFAKGIVYVIEHAPASSHAPASAVTHP